MVARNEDPSVRRVPFWKGCQLLAIGNLIPLGKTTHLRPFSLAAEGSCY